MAFLFSKHRRQSSVDQQDPHSIAASRRKPSLDVLAGEGPHEASPPTTGASKIAVLKHKLTSKSILNVSAKQDDPSAPNTPSTRRFSLSGQNSSPTATSPNSPTAAISKFARRSSLATSAIPQVPPTSSERLANITSSQNYPPGTTVVGDSDTPLNENAARRGSENVPLPSRGGLNDVWKPIDPERRPIAVPATQTAPVRPAVSSAGNPDSTGSANTIPVTPVSPGSQPTGNTTKSPSGRPEIGKITIPPPHLPSRLASSHFRDSPGPMSPGGWAARTPGPGSARTPGGTGWGMTIIPSTPLPRPIANLPTLNPAGGSAPGSRASSRPSSIVGYAGGYGFPVMANGGDARSEDNAGPSGSTATSPIHATEASPAEIRRAKKHMPVMLREPSHRPAAQTQEPQEESDEDDDDDDESSSEEGSADNSSDAETETEEAVPRRSSAPDVTRDRTGSASSGTSTSSSISSDDTALQADITSSLATAGARSLLHNRPRQSSAPHHPGHGHHISVASIIEENEDDGAPAMNFGNYNMASSPMQLTSAPAPGTSDTTIKEEAALANKRQADRPRLSLPSLDSARPISTQPTSWGLATPGTPTAAASSFFNSSAGESSSWTSFGTQTPTGITPGPFSGFPPQSLVDQSVSQDTPSGLAPEASVPAQPESDSQPGPSSRSSNGYFDSTLPNVATSSSTGAGQVTGVGEDVSTPTQADIPGRRPSEEAPDSVAAPLADLNLGPPVGTSSRSVEVPETLSETPAASVVSEPPLHLAVVEHATATDEPVLVNTIPEPTQSARPRANRPTLNKHASRSMVNLSLSARDPLPDPSSIPLSAGMSRTATNASVVSNVSGRPPSGVRTPGSTRSSVDWTRPPPTPGVGMMQPFKFPNGAEPQQSPKQMVQNRQLQALGPSPLKRRRSMDDIHVKLPDYAPPAKGVYLPRPREEEGREKLPEYFCHVHIEGYLPRKMEFTSPGVQARDRSWKRHYFVIHGTALSVYKHDIHKVPLKAGDPHAVPEVDEADYDNLHVHRPGELRRGSLASTSAAAAVERRNSPVPQGNSPNASRRGSVDTSATGAPRESLVAAAAARRMSSTAGTSISNSSTNGPDAKDLALFTSSSSSTVSGPRRGSVSSSQLSHGASATTSHARDIGVHLPFHGNNTLIKQYTLQNAESGLAADYVKKRNVVRVRVEGEQFLLQTESAKDVVDWIEALQAATNVALDLDTRPMPKIITLPRRRRRRRPGEAAPPAQQTGVPDTEDTPEGNARAVAEAERLAAATREQNIDDMERMLAEDQAA